MIVLNGATNEDDAHPAEDDDEMEDDEEEEEEEGLGFDMPVNITRFHLTHDFEWTDFLGPNLFFSKARQVLRQVGKYSRDDVLDMDLTNFSNLGLRGDVRYPARLHWEQQQFFRDMVVECIWPHNESDVRIPVALCDQDTKTAQIVKNCIFGSWDKHDKRKFNPKLVEYALHCFAMSNDFIVDLDEQLCVVIKQIVIESVYKWNCWVEVVQFAGGADAWVELVRLVGGGN